MPYSPSVAQRRCCGVFTSIIVMCMGMASVPVFAGDWPQILGPGRTGVAEGESLLESWPANGPEVVWEKSLGSGFAGVAVRDDRAILFHRRGNQEIVEAIEVASGTTEWISSAACDYRSGISSDSGPRCVPVISGTNLITFGAAGQLRCLQWDDGKEIWSRNLQSDFGAPEGYFGSGSTPVVYKDLVIVNVGSRDSAAVVALSLKNGKTLWQSYDDTASYSAPMIATINDQDVVIVITRLNVLMLSPSDGQLLSEFSFGMRGPTVNGASPVVIGKKLFVSSSYRVGSVLADLNDGFTNLKRSGEKLLATQYATPILDGRVLFAVDGRQDSGTATLKCIDPIQEKILWQETGFDYGTLIRADQDYLFLTCGGELIRFSDSTLTYKEISRQQVLSATPQGYRLPALSNGRLFVRDDQVLKCLQVGKTN